MLVKPPNPHPQFHSPSRHSIATTEWQTAIDQSLTAQEQRDYEKHTGVIRSGMSAFVDVGKALADVRDRQLFIGGGYTSFKQYCEVEFGLIKRRVYQIIEAAEVSGRVKNFSPTTPLLESHAAAIAKVGNDPEEQAEAWERAVETAPKDDEGKPKITAKHVQYLGSVKNFHTCLTPPPSISSHPIRHPGGTPSRIHLLVLSRPGVFQPPCWTQRLRSVGTAGRRVSQNPSATHRLLTTC